MQSLLQYIDLQELFLNGINVCQMPQSTQSYSLLTTLMVEVPSKHWSNVFIKSLWENQMTMLQWQKKLFIEHTCVISTLFLTL